MRASGQLLLLKLILRPIRVSSPLIESEVRQNFDLSEYKSLDYPFSVFKCNKFVIIIISLTEIK